MIFSSEFFRQEKAFSKVLIHPVVQTPDGKRMSKSKGNAIDPLLLVRNYGADASRMWYAQVGVFSSQDVRFPGKSFPSKEDTKMKDWECEVMEKYKRFANKLYNSAKFTCMNLVEDPSYKSTGKFKVKPITELNFNEMTFADRWIIYELEHVLSTVSTYFTKYDIGAAQEKIFEFTWTRFCDWYIELSKIQNNLETKNQILFYVLASAVRALQPFMPFVTEEIWQSLIQIVDFSEVEKEYFTEEYKAKPYVAFTKFPEYQKAVREAVFIGMEEATFRDVVVWSMKLATEIISKIRNARQSLNISWSDEIKLFISNPSEADISTLIEISPYIKRIAKCSDIFMDEAVPEKPLSSFMIKSEGGEKREIFFHIPLKGLVDIDKLKTNLEDKLSKLNKSKQQLETRLAAMLNKAPEERIQEAKGDLEKLNLEEKIYLEELNSL
jgi:valyl-tRNA synthetase